MFNWRAFWREEDGATAVEFALVLPLLLSIIFGIVAFGQYFAIANSLQQFAAEAARYSVSEPYLADRKDRAETFLSFPGGRFSFLDADHIISKEICIFPEDQAECNATNTYDAVQITLTYDLNGTAVAIADSFLGIGIENITRRSYLAY
ncbi:TadE/TadG family type IV pilus assembly protein [Pacificibacter marinus]|uniref:TadE/TadG family type IV pilus assembly protein n=1 Tax=Pacificibacter marinus TaxID=658057 RepID=UPI001C068CEA|nr:TadE/TadG family type IV pilus assembly protein [Pacificibacter marinus]MBU2865843.1 pilus assembly protein [Pacificibacter marinus]